MKGTNEYKIMNHGEERLIEKTRLAKKSNEVLRIKEKKEFPRMQLTSNKTTNTNTSISPAWSCNCSMITCHVIVCIMHNIKVKMKQERE